jgi:hypothetical protein
MDDLTDFDKLVNKCSFLTSINAHTDAYLLGIKALLNMTKELGEMAEIKAESERVGFLPEELQHKRRAIYEKMMRYAKAQFTSEQYRRFYMSF